MTYFGTCTLHNKNTKEQNMGKKFKGEVNNDKY